MELAELVAALRPSEAAELVRTQRVDEWCDRHDISCTREVLMAVLHRGTEPAELPPPPPPPPPDPRRRDTEELKTFVKQAVKLPLRLREVAALCLDQGLTIDQCAGTLGIKRETVRVHLRRLRTMRKTAERRRGQLIASP